MLFNFPNFSHPFTISFRVTTPHTKYLTSHAISSYSRVAGVEFTAYRAELGNLKLSPGTK